MSRLRRLLETNRVFFVTTHFQKARLPVSEAERDVVLRSLGQTRGHRKFLLLAYVVMPTHVHLVFAPALGDTMGSILREFKLTAAKRILAARRSRGSFWQARSFDRIVRTSGELIKTLEYVHWNPVRDEGLQHPSEWRWSSWSAWMGGAALVAIDRVDFPTDEKTLLGW